MQKPPKKPLNRWLALINIPFQMGIVIFLFAYLGQWLDGEYNSGSIFTIVLSLVSVFIALYIVIKQLKNLNN